MSDNRCVCCGTEIPEGTLVCNQCIDKSKREAEIMLIEEEARKEENRVRRMNTVDYIVWDWVMPFIVCVFILYMIFGWR